MIVGWLWKPVRGTSGCEKFSCPPFPPPTPRLHVEPEKVAMRCLILQVQQKQEKSSKTCRRYREWRPPIGQQWSKTLVISCTGSLIFFFSAVHRRDSAWWPFINEHMFWSLGGHPQLPHHIGPRGWIPEMQKQSFNKRWCEVSDSAAVWL